MEVRSSSSHIILKRLSSGIWTQIKADVTQRTVYVTDSDEATTRGAAILAGVAMGVYPGFGEAVERLLTVKRRYRPQEGLTSVYGDRYEIYRRLYPALEHLMAMTVRQRKEEEGVTQ